MTLKVMVMSMITADQWNLYIITDTSWYSRYSSTCGVHSSWSQVSAVHQDVMIHSAIVVTVIIIM